jgi:hypothetical protein
MDIVLGHGFLDPGKVFKPAARRGVFGGPEADRRIPRLVI